MRDLRRRARPILLAVLPLAWSLLASRPATALDPSKALTQFRHDVWQDELPQSTVHTILQTRDGYLWFGTYEGLVRYDGARFVVFDANRKGQILGTTVSALTEGRDGTLWIATNGGLASYLNGEFTTWTVADGLPGKNLSSLWEAPDGTLWIGTDRGVSRLQDGKFSNLTTSDGLPNDAVRSIRGDRDGNVWIATDRGLARWKGGRVAPWQGATPLPDEVLRPLLVDSRGDLWIGSNGGLSRLHDGAVTTWTTKEGLPHNFVRALAEDRDGNLWVGTENGGLARFRDGRFDVLVGTDGISNDFVRSIFEDREGDLWVGTNGGLNRFSDGKFATWTTREGLSHDFVRAIFEDRQGVLWFGTDGGGLCRFDGHGFTPFRASDGLASDSVRSITQSRDGSLWIGTRAGLSRFDGKSFTSLTAKDGLGGDLVRAVVEGRDGTLWVGTEGGGLSAVRGGRVESRTTREGLSNNDVRSLFEDHEGNLWIGTYGGLDRLRDGKLNRYSTKDGLSNDIVFSFHEDREGKLWVGTDSGLNLRRGDGFVGFTIKQGLCDNKVFRILEDDDGYLWYGSNRGVCRVSRRELEQVADGKLERVHATAYGKSDGMRTNQCNGSSQPAGARTRDGRLWFPTTRGAVSIDPRAIRLNTLPPPVHVEEVSVDGRALDLRRAIELSSDREKLEFHYTALSLLAPERVRFRYRLFGYDKDWIDAGGRRIAYYTHIPPGEYRFEVAAANNDGVWNEDGAAVRFRIRPPWWRTWWAILGWIAGGSLIAHLAIRWRTRALRRANEKLEKKVAERTAQLDHKNEELAVKLRELEVSERRAHESENRALEASRAKSAFLSSMSHELRTPLNSIIGFAEILIAKLEGELTEKHLKFLRNIRGSGQHLLGLINDVLDLSKIEAGRMELFPEPFSVPMVVEGVRAVMRGVADSRGIEIEVDIPENLPPVTADPGKFKQVLFNLISNAVKFSPEKSVVTVRARRVDGDDSPLGVDCVRLDVIDRGIGIAKEDQEVIFEEFRQLDTGTSRHYEGTGLGLTLVRSLLELHGGRIQVDSAPGKGSTFTVYLPFIARIAPLLPEPGGEKRPSTRIALPGGDRPRILVVEDDPAAFHALASILEAEGYSAINARHREEAIRFIEAERPALVTLDIVLPGADGWEVLRELKAKPSTRDLPVVIVTMLESRELGLALGANDFFVKPVERQALLRRIRELVSPPTPSRATILLVDDDPAVAEMFAADFEPSGWRLVAARDGSAGLALAVAEKPSVIVLDLMMPGMSGFEVATALAADPATRDIPIVVLTSMELTPADRANLEGRISGLVNKGADSRARLLAAIRKLLRRSGESTATR